MTTITVTISFYKSGDEKKLSKMDVIVEVNDPEDKVEVLAAAEDQVRETHEHAWDFGLLGEV